jgi:hypothetical protein
MIHKEGLISWHWRSREDEKTGTVADHGERIVLEAEYGC